MVIGKWSWRGKFSLILTWCSVASQRSNRVQHLLSIINASMKELILRTTFGLNCRLGLVNRQLYLVYIDQT